MQLGKIPPLHFMTVGMTCRGRWFRSPTQVIFATWRAAGCRPYGHAGGWYRSTARVIFGTWRAAGCRPYGHAGGWYRSSAQVIIGTWHGDESSPLHWVYRVLGNTVQPYRLYSERGGRLLAAPTCRREVVPFIHTGYICDVAGTAHRPFPTVSLIRPGFQPSLFKNVRFCACADNRDCAPNRRIVNCPLSIVN